MCPPYISMTYQHYDISTSWHINIMTYQHYDISTSWHINIMTYQHYDITTLWLINIMTYQHHEISTLWHTTLWLFNIRTYQHYDISTSWHNNIMTYQDWIHHYPKAVPSHQSLVSQSTEARICILLPVFALSFFGWRYFRSTPRKPSQI